MVSIDFVRFDYLLLVTVLLIPFGFIITYTIAVASGHVHGGFPYISDTGSMSPESCIFAQFLTVDAFLAFILIFVRYQQIKLILKLDKDNSNYLNVFNQISLGFGILVCLGFTIVGNFQASNVNSVHYAGAVLAFGGLFFYITLQTILSDKLSSHLYSNINLLIFRIVLIVLSLISILLCLIFNQIARVAFNGSNALHWKSSDGGYPEHIISTTTEWIYTAIMVIALSTFIIDFKRIRRLPSFLSDKPNQFRPRV